MKFEIPASAPKKVLIVGGGVAGMQGALTAAERGHDVILCEKSDRLGGVLNSERNMPFKFRVTDYLDRQERMVYRAGIDVRLNTEVTAQSAEEINAHAIIVCAGGAPIKPSIEGIDGDNVLSAISVFSDPSAVGESALIIGAGFVGLETAIWLAMMGRKVCVIEMADKSGDENTIHRIAVNVQLAKNDISVNYSTKALRISDEGLLAEGPSGKVYYAADTFIYAAGLRPLWEVNDALICAAPHVNVVGDARSPRVIADATREAYHAARNI
jgi:pyruvate/2-oxoglutarate dehydrogenase complex dihydrolipoamide dehydrogenase (E3) component